MLSAIFLNYFYFAKWIGSIKEKIIYIEISYKRVVSLENNIYINNIKLLLLKQVMIKFGKIKFLKE